LFFGLIWRGRWLCKGDRKRRGSKDKEVRTQEGQRKTMVWPGVVFFLA